VAHTQNPITVSVKDAAAMMGVSAFTMYDLLNKQLIVSVYQGRRRLVNVESLRAYITSLPTEPTEPVSA
jgi:excisionase family DNA binding protein